jgi:polyferredoxin
MNTSTTPEEKRPNFTFNRVLLKAKYALYSAIVFFLFANPETNMILQRFFGRFVDFVLPSGAPTITGIFASTGLFFITMLGLMLLPSE